MSHRISLDVYFKETIRLVLRFCRRPINFLSHLPLTWTISDNFQICMVENFNNKRVWICTIWLSITADFIYNYYFVQERKIWFNLIQLVIFLTKFRLLSLLKIGQSHHLISVSLIDIKYIYYNNFSFTYQSLFTIFYINNYF